MPLKKQLTFQPQLSKEWKVVRASIRTQVMLWESIAMLLKLTCLPWRGKTSGYTEKAHECLRATFPVGFKEPG